MILDLLWRFVGLWAALSITLAAGFALGYRLCAAKRALRVDTSRIPRGVVEKAEAAHAFRIGNMDARSPRRTGGC